MNTPNRQRTIKLNKYFFLSGHKIRTKINKSLDIKEKIYDEIEIKNQILKQNFKKIKKIKIDSIKELIYANKNIPKHWKSKLDYPNQVLELFSRDPKFLKYVGTGGNSNRSQGVSKSSRNLTTNNFYKANNNYIDELNKDNKDKNYKKNYKLFNLRENTKNNNLAKFCNTTPSKKNYIYFKDKILNEKEVINILDELQINYPIKEKLNDLFPQEEIQKIKFKNEALKNKANKSFNIRYPIIFAQKNKNTLSNNIYVNLISSYKKKENKVQNKEEKSNKKYINDSDIDLLKIKKEIIKSPQANKHLERINFYGPYYSYCPSCGIRNLKFYQKLPLTNLIKFTNIIKKYRQKK